MRVLTYRGGQAFTSDRHPESFTVLAPKRLQDFCRQYGGTPVGTDKPRFRLALVSSRYQIAGGKEVTTLDEHGNYKSRGPEEVFIPRYHVPEDIHGMYILEMWRPSSWFWEQRANLVSMEYGEDGQTYRRMEPIWNEGAYKGLEWKPGQPFVFPRDLSIDTGELSVRWAVWAAIKRIEMEVDYERQLKLSREEEATRKASERQEYIDISREKGRSNMFLEPTVSMVG